MLRGQCYSPCTRCYIFLGNVSREKCHSPGFPSPLRASAANLTSGSSTLSTLISLRGSSPPLITLLVSMGLPTSPSGTRGKVALLRGGSGPHCEPCVRGLSSILVRDMRGEGAEASGRSRLRSDGRLWVGTDGRFSEFGSCWVYAGGCAVLSCCIFVAGAGPW